LFNSHVDKKGMHVCLKAKSSFFWYIIAYSAIHTNKIFWNFCENDQKWW